ncbi:hypothetical protein ACLB2K_060327 [Fragaria x ananassa]
MEEANLPEEIIMHILSFLPVKSLIRFTCVSKRFHRLFFMTAKPQLVDSSAPLVLNSEHLDLESPSFGDPSSVRELNFPSPSCKSGLLQCFFFYDKNESAIYSSRSQAWKTLEVDFDVFSVVYNQGILLKEALHWVHDRDKILAFDLAPEEEEHKFRTMLLPRVDYYFNRLGVSPSTGGCLSLVRFRQSSADGIHVYHERI